MGRLTVCNLPGASYNTKKKNLFAQLNHLNKHSIQQVPWSAYPYKPTVQFSIAHNGDCIFLKYFVEEKSIRTVNTVINSAVWQDSCVEFFISFDDKGYYNLEFNAIGTALAGFGKNKTDRQLLPAENIGRIKYLSAIDSSPGGGNIHWELLLIIPGDIFMYHEPGSLRGKLCRANFYKCGDKLPEQHFISWSAIHSPEPDFHRPDFFGGLYFE